MKRDQRIDLIGDQIMFEITADGDVYNDRPVHRVCAAEAVVRIARRLKRGGLKKQPKPRKYARIARRLSRTMNRVTR